MVNILASISEFECELIHARMTEGRKRAVANGVKFGPKFKLNSFQKQEALARLAAGESQSVIAKTMASTPLRFRACKGRRLAKTKTLSCAVPSPHVAAQGKAPDRPRHQGLPRPCVGDPGGELLGRTQPNKSAHGVPVPSGPSPSDGRPQPTPPRHALLRAVPALRPRARRPTASVNASTRPCSTSSIVLRFVKRCIVQPTTCRLIWTRGSRSTMRNGHIRDVGASAKPRCRPSWMQCR